MELDDIRRKMCLYNEQSLDISMYKKLNYIICDSLVPPLVIIGGIGEFVSFQIMWYGTWILFGGSLVGSSDDKVINYDCPLIK